MNGRKVFNVMKMNSFREMIGVFPAENVSFFPIFYMFSLWKISVYCAFHVCGVVKRLFVEWNIFQLDLVRVISFPFICSTKNGEKYLFCINFIVQFCYGLAKV